MMNDSKGYNHTSSMAKKLAEIRSEALGHLQTLERQANHAASTRGGLTSTDKQRIADAKDAVRQSSRAEDAEQNAKMAIEEIAKLVQQVLARSPKS